MHDDNPLWYDHVEPDDEPGSVLAVLGAAFQGLAMVVAAVKTMYLLPDCFWVAAFGKEH